MKGSTADRKPVQELISDLTNKDRKAVEEKIKMLQYVLQNCELCPLYLQDYAAGEQTGFKLLCATELVCREITETRDALLTKHKLHF